MQEQSSDLSFCPSFNSYSSDNLSSVAAKVCCESQQSHESDDEREFEFVSVSTEYDTESVAGDDIFAFNDQIRRSFPVSHRDLVLDEKFKERIGTSSSSSDADELEGVSAESYCVWTPKSVESSPGRCKKSSSTGSCSKRWRLLDLVRRSNSSGQESLLSLTPTSFSPSLGNTTSKSILKEKNGGGAVKIGGGGEKTTSAHEAFYVRNRAAREGGRRRSYLPYRQDLVGLFVTNVNGRGRTFPPY